MNLDDRDAPEDEYERPQQQEHGDHAYYEEYQRNASNGPSMSSLLSTEEHNHSGQMNTQVHDAESVEEDDGEEEEEETKDQRDPIIKTTTRPSSPTSIEMISISFHDRTLETLKTELYTAIQNYWHVDQEPPAKRQRKGRRKVKITATTTSSSEASSRRAVLDCLDRLQQRAMEAFANPSLLIDIVRLVLAFLTVLHRHETITKPSIQETIASLPERPIVSYFLNILRRTVLHAASEEDKRDLLLQILAWTHDAVDGPSAWMWILAFVAELVPFLVQETLIQQIVWHQSPEKTIANAVPVSVVITALEYMVEKHPNQTADLLRQVVETLLTSDPSIVTPLSHLIGIGRHSSSIMRALDDQLQWILTQELVIQLSHKLKDDVGTISSELMELVVCQSHAMARAGFHLILLLDKLSQSNQMVASVADFHAKLLQLAQQEDSKALVNAIYRVLPFVCQTIVHSFVETDESKAKAVISCWKPWLLLVAARMSDADVVQALLDADLMVAELQPAPLTTRTWAQSTEALCDLLTQVVGGPSSQEYGDLITSLMHRCEQSASSRRQRRLLRTAQCLLHRNGSAMPPSSDPQLLPIELKLSDVNSLIQSLVLAGPWTASWQRLTQWQTTSGASFWNAFLQWIGTNDQEVEAPALALVAATPFEALEDPVWQYQCLQMLTTAFFHLLRRYRAHLVHACENKLYDAEDLQSRLETLKVVLYRLVALDGGVAHYPASVYGVFITLWMDFLLSTTSPTSIPTHFPNRINDQQPAPAVRNLIRSERTISSKCTNLQSSKVITHTPETLIYRKALDATWEHEMDAASTCSHVAMDVLIRLLAADSKMTERRVKAIVDLLLEHAIPCCGIQPDEVYKEFLPNRSNFDMDLRIEQWLNHFPAFLPLLDAVTTACESMNGMHQALRLVPVLKSALVVLLGHWNSVKGALAIENMDVPPYMRNRNQLQLTTALLKMLQRTQWLPPALGNTAELLPLITPADIRAILFSCWSFLADHPPTKAPSNHPTSIDFYLMPLRKALHRNIRTIGSKYPQFMC